MKITGPCDVSLPLPVFARLLAGGMLENAELATRRCAAARDADVRGVGSARGAGAAARTPERVGGKAPRRATAAGAGEVGGARGARSQARIARTGNELRYQRRAGSG